jgi:RHS repeat-associated protein
VRLLTSSSGAITDSYTYDAFGNLLTSQGTTINPYRYTGQYFDSFLGLYNLRARYYDPSTGRFTSADTADISLNDPTGLNRYLYVASNPLNAIDPTGHDALEEDAEVYQVQESAQPSERQAGEAEADAAAADESHILALEARLLTHIAVVEYNIIQGGKPPFDTWWLGKAGVGLGVYEDRLGVVHKIAALNDVGVSFGVPRQKRTIAMLNNYYEVLRREVEAAGFDIIHSGEIDPTKSKDQVDHEEKYLMDHIRLATPLIMDESRPLVGVSQDTICGTCLITHFQIPDKIVLGSFRYPLDPGRGVYLLVSGVTPNISVDRPTS